MFKKSYAAVVAVSASLACALLFFGRAQIAATSEGDPPLWGATSLGEPVPWPAGLDGCAVQGPEYSPSGRYLGFRTDQLRPLILDLDTGVLHELYEIAGTDRPNLQCGGLHWLSEESLWIYERWFTDEELRDWKPTVPLRFGEGRYRVIDWASGTTILERPGSLPYEQQFGFVAHLTGDRWIVRKTSEPDRKRRFWIYDAPSQSFTGVLLECSPGENMWFAPCGSWVAKLLVPYTVNPWAHELHIELVNWRTGETRSLAPAVPPLPPWGPQITADGRYVISSTFVKAEGRWAPIVFDTQTGQRHDLPQTESWRPVGLDEARGMLLVDMVQTHQDGSLYGEWAQIPLNRVIPP